MNYSYDLFLSYARKDDESFVRKLYEALKARNLKVWYDREAMPNRGLTFSENIKRAVLNSRRLALIVGPHALTSDYVTKEWHTANAACIPIVPVLRQGEFADLPPELAGLDAPDFREDESFEHWLDYLLRQIAEDVPPPSDLHGLRWFQLPRGYILRRELLRELDSAVRGDAIGAGVATSREQVTALQGLAGLGKTTIAAAYAESCAVRRTFDSGVHWLTAGRTADPLPLLTTLGERLGDDRQEYKDLDTAIMRVTHLLSSRRILIVLDDVWEKAVIDAFRQTLDDDDRLLYTTRSPRIVTLTQAQSVRVEALDTAQGVRLIGQWLNRSAQDDAAEHNPHLESERAIAELLDGHTLALSLAAARIAEVGAAYAPILLAEYQKAREGENPFADLELHPGDKNWNVELSLRLSYDALSEDNQRRFRQLGVLAENASFTANIAAAIWQEEDAKRGLRELQNSAMLEPEPDGSAIQHSVLRAYAAALLRKDTAYGVTFARYATYLTEQAKDFRPNQGWKKVTYLMPHLDYAGDTLAVSWFKHKNRNPNFVKLVLEFAHNTRSYVRHYPTSIPTTNGMRLRGMSWLEMGLEASRLKGASQHEMNFLQGIGAAWFQMSELDYSIHYFKKALNLSRKVGHLFDEAAVLNNIGKALDESGKKQEALIYYKKSLSVLRKDNDPRMASPTLTNIGHVYRSIGSLHNALLYYKHSLSLTRKLGYRGGEAANLLSIGGVLADFGENEKALNYTKQALLLHRELGDRDGEAKSLGGVGKIWSDLGEKRKALKCYEEALRLNRLTGDRGAEAAMLNNIGSAWSALGEKNKALEYYGLALSLYRAIGRLSGEAAVLHNIGGSVGEPHKALDYYHQALLLYRLVKDRRGEAGALNSIGLVWDEFNEPTRALEYFEQALELFRAATYQRGQAATLNNMGDVYRSMGELSRAINCFEQSLTLYRAVGDRIGEATGLNNIGTVLVNMRDEHKALEYFQHALSLMRELEDRLSEATILNNIGLIWSNLGDKRTALENHEHALLLYRAIGDQRKEATTLNTIALIYIGVGNLKEAVTRLKQSLDAFSAMGAIEEIASTYIKLALVHQQMGLKNEAIEYGTAGRDIMMKYNLTKDASGYMLSDYDTLLRQIRGEIPKNEQEAIQAFVNADSLAEARLIYEEHEQILASRQVEAGFEHAIAQTEDDNTKAVLRANLDRIRRAKEEGVEAAFAEEVLNSNNVLAAILELIKTLRWEDARNVYENNEYLLSSSMAELLFEQFIARAEEDGENSTKMRFQSLLDRIRRAKVDGIDAAFDPGGNSFI